MNTLNIKKQILFSALTTAACFSSVLGLGAVSVSAVRANEVEDAVETYAVVRNLQQKAVDIFDEGNFGTGMPSAGPAFTPSPDIDLSDGLQLRNFKLPESYSANEITRFNNSMRNADILDIHAIHLGAPARLSIVDSIGSIKIFRGGDIDFTTRDQVGNIFLFSFKYVGDIDFSATNLQGEVKLRSGRDIDFSATNLQGDIHIDGGRNINLLTTNPVGNLRLGGKLIFTDWRWATGDRQINLTFKNADARAGESDTAGATESDDTRVIKSRPLVIINPEIRILSEASLFLPDQEDTVLNLRFRGFSNLQWKGKLIIADPSNTSVNFIRESNEGPLVMNLQEDWNINYPVRFVQDDRISSDPNEGGLVTIESPETKSRVNVESDLLIGKGMLLYINAPVSIGSEAGLIFRLSDQVWNSGRLQVAFGDALSIPSINNIRFITDNDDSWNAILLSLEEEEYVDLISVVGGGTLQIGDFNPGSSRLTYANGKVEIVLHSSENGGEPTSLRMQLAEEDSELGFRGFSNLQWKGKLIIADPADTRVNFIRESNEGPLVMNLQEDWNINYPVRFVQDDRISSDSNEGGLVAIESPETKSRVNIESDLIIGKGMQLYIDAPVSIGSEARLIFRLSDQVWNSGRLQVVVRDDVLFIPSISNIHLSTHDDTSWDAILLSLEEEEYMDLISVVGGGTLQIGDFNPGSSRLTYADGKVEIVLHLSENGGEPTSLRIQLAEEDSEELMQSTEAGDGEEETIQEGSRVMDVPDSTELTVVSETSRNDDEDSDDDAEGAGDIREVQVLAGDSASAVVSAVNTDSGMKAFALFNGAWSSLPSAQGTGDFTINGDVGASFYTGSALKGKVMNASVSGGYRWNDVAINLGVQYAHSIFGKEKQHFVSSVAEVSYYKDNGLRAGGYLGGGGTVAVPAEQKLNALLVGGNLGYQVRFNDIPQAPTLGIGLLPGGKVDVALAFMSGNTKKPVMYLNGEVGVDATLTYLDREQLPDLSLSLTLPVKAKFGMIYDARGQASKYTLVPAFKSGLGLKVSYRKTYSFKIGYEVELGRQYVRNGVSFSLQFSK